MGRSDGSGAAAYRRCDTGPAADPADAPGSLPRHAHLLVQKLVGEHGGGVERLVDADERAHQFVVGLHAASVKRAQCHLGGGVVAHQHLDAPPLVALVVCAETADVGHQGLQAGVEGFHAGVVGPLRDGHEIGHAIYHQALNARSTGGQHKIDDCYEGTLALSEGFATFFSGAINLQADDPDARFGAYLVPRRSPIRIENTPDDVCPGNRNEWRVASVLWDVYDRHSDKQDGMTLPLKDIWAAFSQPDKPAMRSALDAYALLRERLSPEGQAQLRQVFVQNTMEVE